MNKKILAIAVAGIVAAPMAAQAAVEVYGKAHLSVGLTDTGAEAGDGFEMNANNSNVGFRGEEDLGNGFGAIFQAETGFAQDTGVWSDSGRNSFVGLKGDWGKLVLGRHDSPYKLSTGRMDPFSDTQGDYNALMGVSPTGVSHDTRFNNSILYTSPNMAGFTIMGQYGVNDRRDVTVGVERDRSEISLGATYSMGPWFGSLAYQVLTDNLAIGTTEFGDETAIKGGLGFTIAEATTLNVAYETLDSGDAAGDRAGVFFSAEHKMGSHTLAFSYAVADQVGDVENSGASQWTIGGYHNMSKATQLYALYSALEREASAPGYGIFLSGATPVAAGETGSALMVGVIHSFSSK